jgi:hypothetical protein
MSAHLLLLFAKQQQVCLLCSLHAVRLEVVLKREEPIRCASITG